MPVIEALEDPGDKAALRRQTAQRLGLGEEMAVDGSLSALACRLGTILVFKFNKQKGYASWPYSKLAEWVNRSERQVQTAAKELAARNYVRIQRTRRGWTLYRLVVDEPRGGHQDTREIAGLISQDKQSTSTLNEQDNAETSRLNAKIGSFLHQDWQFSAPRPEASFQQYTVLKYPEENPCSPHIPPSTHDGHSGEQGRSVQTLSSDLASAIAALGEEAGLAEGEAEALARCWLNAGERLLLAKSEADYTTIKGSGAGLAIERVGLRLACGGV